VFLANLLPGLRELRAPLAAGYAFLLALFVWLGGRLPSKDQPAGALGELARAAEKLGPGLSLAILSFVAYLLGSLIADAASAFIERLGRSITARGQRSLHDLAARACDAAIGRSPSPRRMAAVTASAARLTDRSTGDEEPWDDPFLLRGLLALKHTKWTLTQRVGCWATRRRTAFNATTLSSKLGWWRWTVVTPSELYEPRTWQKQWSGGEVDDGERRTAVDAMAKTLADTTYKELDLVRTRLMGEHPELYGAVDRLRSEAELRQAVTFPLHALAFGLASRGVWLAGVPLFLFASCLPAQGRRRTKAANDLLAEALVLDRVKAPTLERFTLENKAR
jgi:hypothetical protein